MSSRAAIVVAHPDDEALWLSSAIASAERIVFCHGDPFGRPAIAEARRRAVDALPFHDIIDLALPESGSRLHVDWAHPKLTPTGIEITDTAVRERYEANYPKMVEGLRRALAGFGVVYTHNPWGDYGHPDHIQVHRAVAALQAELGYAIWFSNYVGSQSWLLAEQLGQALSWAERRIVPPDVATARRLMQVYRRHGAWTWTRAHCWPTEETLYAMPPVHDAAPRRTFSGEWLLDVEGLRWWPPFRPKALRRLP
jgi:LmbE family N-acetylglucosaminyl deacetylase